MAKRDLPIRDMAHRLLAHEAGNIRDSEHLTGAAQSIFHKLRGQLAPLIGPGGYRVILGRSLQLGLAELPTVSGVELSSEEGEELKGLFERLQRADYAQAEKVISAVLVEFLGLLTAFLGWDLYFRLVNAAWPELALGEEPDAQTKTAAGP